MPLPRSSRCCLWARRTGESLHVWEPLHGRGCAQCAGRRVPMSARSRRAPDLPPVPPRPRRAAPATSASTCSGATGGPPLSWCTPSSGACGAQVSPFSSRLTPLAPPVSLHAPLAGPSAVHGFCLHGRQSSGQREEGGEGGGKGGGGKGGKPPCSPLQPPSAHLPPQTAPPLAWHLPPRSSLPLHDLRRDCAALEGQASDQGIGVQAGRRLGRGAAGRVHACTPSPRLAAASMHAPSRASAPSRG